MLYLAVMFPFSCDVATWQFCIQYSHTLHFLRRGINKVNFLFSEQEWSSVDLHQLRTAFQFYT